MDRAISANPTPAAEGAISPATEILREYRLDLQLGMLERVAARGGKDAGQTLLEVARSQRAGGELANRAIELLKLSSSPEAKSALDSLVVQTAKLSGGKPLDRTPEMAHMLARCGTAKACEYLSEYASSGESQTTVAYLSGYLLATIGTPEADSKVKDLLKRGASVPNGIYGACAGLTERVESDENARGIIRDVIFRGHAASWIAADLVYRINTLTDDRDGRGPKMTYLGEHSLQILRDALVSKESSVAAAAAFAISEQAAKGGRAFKLAADSALNSMVQDEHRIKIIGSLWQNRKQDEFDVRRTLNRIVDSTDEQGRLLKYTKALLESDKK